MCVVTRPDASTVFDDHVRKHRFDIQDDEIAVYAIQRDLPGPMDEALVDRATPLEVQDHASKGASASSPSTDTTSKPV